MSITTKLRLEGKEARRAGQAIESNPYTNRIGRAPWHPDVTACWFKGWIEEDNHINGVVKSKDLEESILSQWSILPEAPLVKTLAKSKEKEDKEQI